MRYINIKNILLPVGWEEKAQALNKQLTLAEDSDARKLIINNNPIWKDLFIPLNKNILILFFFHLVLFY